MRPPTLKDNLTTKPKEPLDSLASFRYLSEDMSRKFPHNTAWEVALKVEAKEPHRPEEMRSGNSKGPIKMWICAVSKCNEYSYTYSSDATPFCEGGMKWSFLTSLPFDSRIHSPGALGS